ncbi:MAG: thiamine diphosphokinase [Legionellales bacterium]|nr:thiamine diphosphokinase [Legionellales bacterium]
MKANVILNGDINKNFILENLDDTLDIYAIDGAIHKISSLGLPIKAILGDLDSIGTISPKIKTIRLENQNYTDFDKAINYLQKIYQEIIVYGGSGGELDHCLGNLYVASKYLDKIRIKFIDQNQNYFLTRKNIRLTNIKDRIVSIIPFPKVRKLRTTGLEFELINENLALEQKISIRNLAIMDEVSIEFDSGTLAIFIASDIKNETFSILN